LKRSPGSLSGEIKKNSASSKYDPEKANHKAYVRRKYSKYEGMKVESDIELRNYVEEKTKSDWSPEAISGRIKEVDTQIRYVGFKGIYKFIYSVYGRNLEKHLTYKGRKRKPKTSRNVLQIKDRIFIDKRPKIVDKRRRFGDWEGDFIISRKNDKTVLLTLYERKGRYTLIRKLANKKIETVHRVVQKITGGIIINTLTLDNDLVFRKHKILSEILGCPVYFCHPYHSWEKGGVENANKLIRRYIPKGSDISQYSDEYIQMVQDKLNDKPRKCLNYKTPNEVMRENNQLKDEIKYLLSDMLKVEENKKAGCSA
jgi:transposase, IS30 family